MNPFHMILWALPIACLQADEAPDLLRFTNTDRLQGKFLGITEGSNVQWQSTNSNKPLDFQTRNLRHIVLHSGKSKQPLQSLSYVDLTNGDRIPGTVSGLNEQTLTLDTEFAGTLNIPRNKVRLIASNPMGDSVQYHGPFSTDGWFMKNPSSSTDILDANNLPPKSDKDAEKSDKTEKSFDRWSLSGSAWYWNHKSSGTGLFRKDCMPDVSVARFDLKWKGRLNLAIGLHADFQPSNDKPQANQREVVIPQQINNMINSNDPSLLPGIFGNAYVLQINSNYAMLSQTIVNAEGESSIKRIEGSTGRLRIGENNRSTIEIRSDQKNGNITLFVDGEFVTQWATNHTPDTNSTDKPHSNKGIGFASTFNDAAVKISDIMISEWNGMPDSARSMQNDEQDVVLMTNGLDRYSGKAIRLNDQGMLEFEGRYGKFEFPIRAIAELHVANNNTEPSAKSSENQVTVKLDPVGTVSGTSEAGDNSSISLNSPIMGKINLSLNSAVILEWNTGNQIDAWDESF